MKRSTREWLNAAEDDLATIKSLIENPDLTNIIAFHAQQAIEKTLKAIIEEYEIGFIKTHNIQTLSLIISEKIPVTINEYIVEQLDRMYIDARYPGDFGLMPFGKPTISEATAYYQQAKALKEQVEKILISDTKR
jgi:HEPN domain-containing protein